MGCGIEFVRDYLGSKLLPDFSSQLDIRYFFGHRALRERERNFWVDATSGFVLGLKISL